MQYFLLAMAIMRVMKDLKQGGDGGVALDAVIPSLVEFFGKGKVSAEEVSLFKDSFKDLVALIKD